MEYTVHTILGPDRIMTIWLDQPHKAVNTITSRMLAELTQVVEQLEHDSDLAGVVFTSGKDGSFLMGADVFELKDLNDRQREDFLNAGQQLFARIERLNMPTIAAINGHCLGGGLELALACRYRVAADDGAISIGLPELNLGIIPAWGGTVRLPRLIGLPSALRLILTSKHLSPRKAARIGVIDEVVRPEALLTAAKRRLVSRERPRRPSWTTRAVAAIPWAREFVLKKARQQTLAKTFGNYPAAEKLIQVMRTGQIKGIEGGMAAEREALLDLIRTDTCANLMRLFFLRRESKHWVAERIRDKPVDVACAAVIGGGTMGSGIVHKLIRAGIHVRLIEVSPAAVSAALQRIRKLLDEEVADKSLDPLAARHAFNRVMPSTEWTGLNLADFIVEAVAEQLDVKKEVFAKLDRLARPQSVLASNTSSLRIADLAGATSNPRRVIGLHFFNPVSRMPLVEIVAAPLSGGQALATAARLVDRIGKLAVVVQDAPGFVVNRILLPHLAEAIVMAAEGVDIRRIDRAMTRWGMPMGPFELLDQVGLDIAAHVLSSLEDPFVEYARRVTAPGGIQRAIDRGWLGRKSGRGFYVYEPSRRRRPRVHEAAIQEIRPRAIDQTGRAVDAGADVSEQEIQDRLVLPMVNEAARLLHDGVIDRPDALDLATAFGLGFAPFRGGVVRFVDSVGAGELVSRLEELSIKYGVRFRPNDLLRELAVTATRLSSWAPSARGVAAQVEVPEMAHAASGGSGGKEA